MKIQLDFYILETGSPRKISIFDDSIWEYSENITSYIGITTPGSKKEKNFTFVKNAINTFNSHNLGLSCFKGDCKDEEYVDLPDGIYVITLKSGYEGIEETKHYLKTDSFELKFAEKIRNAKEEEIDDLMKVYFNLMSAKDNVKLGYWEDADLQFTDAINKLKKLNCGTNSNCE